MNRDDQKRPENAPVLDDQQVLIDALAKALVKATDNPQPQKAARPAVDGDEAQFDIVEFFYRVLAKIHYVIGAAVLGAVVMAIYAIFATTPVYQATAKLYIMNQDSVSINVSDLQIGSMLTMDYKEVFKTWEVHEMVRSKLNLDYSYSQLQDMLSITNPNDTRVLYITVTNENAELASEIANAYAQSGKEFILQTMDTKEPNVFSVALVPSAAVSTSKTGYVLRGFIVGTVLALGVIFLIFVLDDRPRTPEDIMKAAGIPTLAIVPVEEKAVRAAHRIVLHRKGRENKR